MAGLPKLINESNIESFLAGIDNVMTDCDGVLWASEEVIEGANTALNKLRKMGKKIFYVTNNSTKTRETLVTKCTKFGFIANDDETISTSFIVAQHLKNINFNKKVYILGSEGIASELDLVGIPHIGVGPDPIPENVFDLAKLTKLDPDVGAVVVGFDAHFNISKILKAASYLQNPDCLFLATNKDEKFPLKDRSLTFPGTGVFVNAVETATGRISESLGKPSPKMFTCLEKKFNLDPKRTIMIGDRCSTDILLGKNCGLQTLVVLSGINTWEDMEAWAKGSDPEEKRMLADFYLPSLGDLAPLLPE
ncbi:UNVERIFIED_CONTAM: hypothetical protein GTU68_015389 [Idotea baltica]|nr:hypothetical protein [Idotea baltica]MCL4134858.1 hypothetical protein [Idotea baltica]